MFPPDCVDVEHPRFQAIPGGELLHDLLNNLRP